MYKKIFTVAVATFMTFGLTAQKQIFETPKTEYSQNKRKVETFDSQRYHKVEVSDGLQVTKIDTENRQGVKSYVAHREIKNQPSKVSVNHNFKLTIVGDFERMLISNGKDYDDDDYFEDNHMIYMGNIYESLVPEGYYDIVIYGYMGDGITELNPVFYFIEQLHITEDTELTADFADATNKIELELVDINNNPLDGMLLDTEIACILIQHPSISSVWDCSFGSWDYEFWPNFALYVNDMGTRNKLIITAQGYDPEENLTYYLSFPAMSEINSSLVLEYSSDELVHFNQMYNISKELTEDSYANLSRWIFMYQDGLHGWYGSSGWSIVRTYDRNKPFSLYTNAQFNDSPQSGDVNILVSPVFYEFYDIYGGYPRFEGKVIPFPMAKNDDGELIIDFFAKFNDFDILDIDNFTNELAEKVCNNPLSRVYDMEEYFYEGFRTPLLYHQALHFSANPFGGGPILRNNLLYLGEYGEQKYNHGDLIVNIKGDDTEIYNDEIYILNGKWDLNPNCSQYKIEVINDQVFAYGKNMVNSAIIEFDVTKSDPNPPTLTMLRVIDNEKISINVTDPNSARLEIAAGDFFAYRHPHYRFAFGYDKKPNIEIFWSSDGVVFNELPVIEDESKFYIGSGNFFNAALAPIFEAGVDYDKNCSDR